MNQFKADSSFFEGKNNPLRVGYNAYCKKIRGFEFLSFHSIFCVIFELYDKAGGWQVYSCF